VLAVVLSIAAGLAVLDRFLADMEMTEVRTAAERSWRNGKRLLREGNAGEALDALRNAHSLERENIRYELDMVSALVALGKTSDADPLVEDALQRKPNDGAVNLAAARLMRKEGDAAAAESYYHRAVYGEWPSNSGTSRQDARLELIEFLKAENSRQRLLAELISLEAESGGEVSVERRLGPLFLAAESPARAAAIYRALISKDPGDASAYEGLGEAEMQLGQYRPARAAFLQAAALGAGRQGVSTAPRLMLLNEVIQLDPTPRRLPTAEKFERSLRILALAAGDLQARLEKKPDAANGESAALLKSAADAGTAKPRVATNELAEQNLDLAMKIWKARVAMFGASTAPDEEALRLTMEHLGQ
jgi:tetratricopeptide (TPR) repeat protein